ncbi:hypothetical protein MC885_013663, partial [Smutsia gigantea]
SRRGRGGGGHAAAAWSRPRLGAELARYPAPAPSLPHPSPTPFSTHPRCRKGRGRGKESAVLWKGAEGGAEKKRKKKGTETWPSAVGAAVRQAAPRRPAAGPGTLPRTEAHAPGRYPLLHAAPLETWPVRRRRRRSGCGGGGGSGRGSKLSSRPCRGRPGREAGAFMPQEGAVSWGAEGGADGRLFHSRRPCRVRTNKE